MSIGLLRSGIKIDKVIAMRKHVKTKILSVFLVATILSVGLLGYYFGALGAYIGNVTEVWVQPPFHEASYVVGVYNSTFFYAQNSTTGQYEWLSTNDDTVMQNAIDTTNSSGGGVVYVKAGSYSASITVKANVLLVLEVGVSGVTYTINTNAYCIRYSGGYGWFEQPLNMTGHEIQFGAFHTGTSAPSSPNTGQWWYDTNTYVLKIYNGTDWATVQGTQGPAGPAGSTTQFGAYTFIIYQNETDGDTEARDWQGALQYSSSDDDSVFQDCIDDMDAWNDPGIIFVKNGTYTFNTMVTLDQSGIVIQGESMTSSHTGTSISWSTGTNTYAFKIESSYCQINDLYIDMNELSGCSGIWLEDAPRNIIHNVYLNECAVDGIYLNSSGGEINSNRIEKCTMRQPGRSGVYIDDDVGHTWVNDCVISDSTDAPKITDYGIYTTSDEKENKFTNNRIWGVMNAICLDDVTAVIVQHNVMTDNDRGILLLQSNNDVLISGNRFWWTNRYDTQAWDNRSDIVIDSSSDQWCGLITDNEGHGQSEARHFIWCSNDNILEQWVMDSNACISYADTEYDQGTQSGLTVGDNT